MEFLKNKAGHILVPGFFIILKHFICMFIFACPKTNPKGHPTVPTLRGYQHTKLLMIDTLRFSLLTGRWKLTACGGSNRRSLRLPSRHFPSTAAMLSGTERVWYLKDKIFAVSRSRAAQQKTEKRLGGVPRKGCDFPMSPVLCEQHPSRGYKLRVVRRCQTSSETASDRLHFLLVRFLYASKENEHIIKRIH